ncbi:MAG: hypothetical protein ACK59G_03770 [Cyanobacteriota bacterium]|jgi:hypothetical protein
MLLQLRREGNGCAEADTVGAVKSAPLVIDLTDFKRDLSELSDRLGHAQDCL